MFIRRTKTSSSLKASHYTFRLVQTYRVADKVKQKTLLNLGAHFDLDQALWPELCQCLEARLEPTNNTLFADDDSFNAQVMQWVERLLPRLRTTQQIDEQHEPWVETVDLNTQSDDHCRTVGLERLCIEGMHQLGLDQCLEQLPIQDSYKRLAQALIAARMIAPDSERATCQWLEESSALGELLQFKDNDLNLDRLYRVGDALYAHKDTIEQHLQGKVQALYGGEGTIVLYDLTNTWFCTNHKESELAQFGRGKQRGSKDPLVTLGLSLNEFGFPMHSEFLPGNVSEPGTLKEAIDRLEHQTSSAGKPLVIMDAGICTQANKAWLVEQGYDYLTIERSRQDIPDRPEDERIESAQSGTVRTWRVDSDEGCVHLVVHSPTREAKETAIRDKKQREFEAALDYLHEGLSQPRRMKSVEKVQQKIGRLKEKYRLIQRDYDIKVEIGDNGRTVTAISYCKNTHEQQRNKRLGSYVLSSSRTDLGQEELIRLYWQLTDIEATFRSVKAELGMRPIYHQKDERIKAHIWISLLAYYVVHHLRSQLKIEHCHDSWSTIRKRIGYRVRLTTLYINDKKQWVGYRRDTPPQAYEAELLRKLKLPCSTYRRKIIQSNKV